MKKSSSMWVFIRYDANFLGHHVLAVPNGHLLCWLPIAITGCYALLLITDAT